jgi:hypothetical protein
MSKILGYNEAVERMRNRKAENINEAALINEGAFKVGDSFMVMSNIEVKPSIISQFKRKAKEEHNVDLTERWSDSVLAEWLVNYVVTKYINVDSIPVAAILGISQEGKPGEAPVAPTPEIGASTGDAVTIAPEPTPAMAEPAPAMPEPSPVMPEASIEKYA